MRKPLSFQGSKVVSAGPFYQELGVYLIYKSDLKFSLQGTEPRARHEGREEKASWEKENPSGIAAA